MDNVEKPTLEAIEADRLVENSEKQNIAEVPEGQRQESAADTAVENREVHETGQETEGWDPAKEIVQIDAALAENKKQIDQARANLEESREKLKALRESMGLPPGSDEPIAEQRRLDGLLTQQEKLESQHEENEAAEDLNKVFEELNALPKAELLIIIETGKRADGSELQGKNGKINPDVAKKLGQLAEQGVKKITKLIMESMLAIVKGILSGFFSGAKEAAGESSETSSGN